MNTTETNYFELMKANKGIIQEVDEEQYHYALGVLPPIYLKIPGISSFATDETYSHENGIPTYYCYAESGGKYYGILSTLGEAKRKFQQAINFNKII